MVRMTEILGEARLRPKNEITVPPKVRGELRLKPDDLLGFDKMDNGHICVYKIVFQRMRNRKTCKINDGGEDAHGDSSRS